MTARYCKRRKAGRHLHLYVDRAGLDPLKGYGRNPLNHIAPRDAIEGSGEPDEKSRTLPEHIWCPGQATTRWRNRERPIVAGSQGFPQVVGRPTAPY